MTSIRFCARLLSQWHRLPADDLTQRIGQLRKKFASRRPMPPIRRLENRRSLIGAVCLFVSVVGSAFAQPGDTFVRANDEYAKGKFQDAVREYESLVQAKQWSAPLFYNLGNAHFRADDLGRSILNYERALALDPQHPEAAANLALAREEARALELQHGRFDPLLKRITTNQVTVVAVVAFWIGVIGLTVIFLTRHRSAMPLLVTSLAFAITLLSIFAVYQLETTRRTMAIVTAPEVQARLATADNANSVLQLPAGSEVRVLSQRGDWAYALLPNNLRGWIPTSSVEQIRL